MKRWFIEQKKQHVASWRASGLTRQQYCELNDIPFTSLNGPRMSQRLSGVPANSLKGWAGNLVVDGYPAYETLAGQNKGIALTGCWAHARRNFADLYKMSKDPKAEMAIRQIAGLYRLEKKIRHRPEEKIRQWRQPYARPVLEKLSKAMPE